MITRDDYEGICRGSRVGCEFPVAMPQACRPSAAAEAEPLSFLS